MAQDARPQGAFAHPVRNIAALGIEPGMVVLDFGAGSGAYVLAMAEAMDGSGRVYALDVQRDLLRRIRAEAQHRGFDNVAIIWADAEQPEASKLADASVDLVLISNLLFQIEAKMNVLLEAHRILRPRGKLAVIDWLDSFGGMGPHRRDVVPKESARSLAEQAHFALEKEFEAGAHHYGLIFRPVQQNV